MSVQETVVDSPTISVIWRRAGGQTGEMLCVLGVSRGEIVQKNR